MKFAVRDEPFWPGMFKSIENFAKILFAAKRAACGEHKKQVIGSEKRNELWEVDRNPDGNG